MRSIALTPEGFVAVSCALRTSLLRFALSRGADYDDAENAIQSLLLAIAKEPGRYATRYDPATGTEGLYRLLCSALSFRLKQEQRERQQEPPAGLLEESAQRELNEYEQAELRLALIGADLTPQQREALEARLAGYTNAEIAEGMEITIQAVGQLLRRAGKRLAVAGFDLALFRWLSRVSIYRRPRTGRAWTGWHSEAVAD